MFSVTCGFAICGSCFHHNHIPVLSLPYGTCNVEIYYKCQIMLLQKSEVTKKFCIISEQF